MFEDKINQKIKTLTSGFDFLKIFGCFKMAMNPNKLITAFAMVFVLGFFGLIFDFSSQSVVVMDIEEAKMYNHTVLPSFGDGEKVSELDVYESMPQYLDKFISDSSADRRQGVFATLCRHLCDDINDVSVRLLKLDIVGVFTKLGESVSALNWAVRYHTLYMFVFFLVFIAVTALGGGAICRAASLELCAERRPSLLESLDYSRKRFFDFLCAPLAPLALVLIFGSLISVIGFIGNLPWVGEIIMGIFTIFALLIGFVLVMIIIGFAGGVHLMFPAVAIENSDFNDAVSRGYCYAYSKPWLLGLYGLISAVYGAICYLFIRLCAFVLLRVTYAFLSFGIFVDSNSNEGLDKLKAIWQPPQFFNLTGKAAAVNIDWSEHLSHLLVSLAVLIISAIVTAFLISFYFSCCTVIYTLCRKAVDKDPIEKITLKENKILNSEENYQ